MKSLNITILAYVLFFISILDAKSQGETNNWYFGYGNGLRLDFNTSPPTLTNGYPLITEEGSSGISDAAGNPLFYTDGVTVWDATTNTSFGGSMNGGKSSSQSAVVMPKPGATNEWLIFTSTTDPGNRTTAGGLNYYTVSGTPGAFSLSAGTSLAGPEDIGEGLAIIGSTKAGDSFWVIVRERNSSNILAYPVSNTGAVGSPVSSSAGGINFTGYISSIKANTCQDQLAFTYYNQGTVELYDFNTATGQVTMLVASLVNDPMVNDYAHVYGIEFSPNDRYLYISQLDEGRLHQYDIAGGTDYFPASWDGTKELGMLQLAPDGKIYAAIAGGGAGNEYIGVINSPNSATAGANFVFNGYKVNNVPATDGYSFRGLPTFAKSLIITDPTIIPDDTTVCKDVSLTFRYNYAGSIGTGINDFKWEVFPPSSSIASNTYTTQNPSHIFNTIGTGFKVRLTIVDICGRTWKDSILVDVIAAKTPSGTISCAGNNINLIADPTDPDKNKYVWYNAALGGSVYGVGSNVSLTYSDYTNVPSSVWVEVANSVSVSNSGANQSVGSPASGFTWPGLAASPYTTTGINVLSDVLTINSFQLKPYKGGVADCNNLKFDVVITNGSGTVVYSKTFTYTTFTCGNVLTVDIDHTLIKGNNYSISIQNASGVSNWYGGASTGSNSVINYPGDVIAAAIGNINYDYKNFSVDPSCSNRIKVDRLCTLPVEYLNISSSVFNNTVIIDWQTAAENNNDYFEVQHSIDGINFIRIGKVIGRGTTNEVNSYVFNHYNPIQGVNYYRLVQYDYDGNLSISKIMSVIIGKDAEILISPNPFDEYITVRFDSGNALVRVRKITGELIDEIVKVNEGVVVVGTDLPPGIYILQVINGDEVSNYRIIKM